MYQWLLLVSLVLHFIVFVECFSKEERGVQGRESVSRKKKSRERKENSKIKITREKKPQIKLSLPYLASTEWNLSDASAEGATGPTTCLSSYASRDTWLLKVPIRKSARLRK